MISCCSREFSCCIFNCRDLNVDSHTVTWLKVETPEEAYDAIKSMKVCSAFHRHIAKSKQSADSALDPRSTSNWITSCSLPSLSPVLV